jgi:hypothetical protein
MMIAFILSTILSTQTQHTVSDRVDLIELNHYHNEQGQHAFSQVIFWHRAPETGWMQVRAWCMVDDQNVCTRRPHRDYETGLYRVEWNDTEKKVQRKITSQSFRESWSQLDPERENKKRLEDRDRLRLSLPFVEVCEE